MFDAHHHLDLIDDEDAWTRARAAGVTGGIIAGFSPDGWGAQMALAREWPELGWTAGLHPWWVRDIGDGTLSAAMEALRDVLGEENGPVGVGELGLDRAREDDAAAWSRQERAFRDQLGLARAANRPVVLHVVRAHGAVLDRLLADGVPQAGGMVHSFSGSVEVAHRYVALGLHVSVGPLVTRAGAKKLRAALPRLPAERLLVETDSPDQLPDGGEGGSRAHPGDSEPALLPRVIAEVAALRGEDPAEVARYTADNGRRLFGLPATR